MYKDGVLQPLEPVPLEEKQQVTVTISGSVTEDTDVAGYFSSEEWAPRHHRFRGVVLLRPAPRIQSHRRPAIQDLSGTETVRTNDDQSAPGSRPPGRV